ncbi:succinate dehydrogenase cytochrome b558 subunit [Mesobacillus zeae]|uniref:Succinate dehydrogenase n=1 Tax=Mesobacillus zeae TaxID=1917180 RepID=A0A398B365_9BACI|nr:succinate dehydrogenase cytochrome b558 subunit [Mesobacillus zeae]RID84399.1 succinate dehydrogenase [Mesobacillus zeae]
MERGKNQHLYRKLHSLSGIIPVGVFLTVHLFVNYTATWGMDAYNTAAGVMVNLPFKIFLESFIIFIPLYFHAIYGMYIAFQSKNNVGSYGYSRNWKFFLQRLSGVITFIFVTWHIWETKVQVEFFDAEANFNLMANIVDNPVSLALYIVGIVAAVYHFANGIWTFLITWGITVSPKSQKFFAIITLGLFVVLSIIGVRAILAFA